MTNVLEKNETDDCVDRGVAFMFRNSTGFIKNTINEMNARLKVNNSTKNCWNCGDDWPPVNSCTSCKAYNKKFYTSKKQNNIFLNDTKVIGHQIQKMS